MRLIDADEVIETLLTTDDVESIFLDLAQNRRLDYLHDVEESDVVDFARDIVKSVIGVINTSPTINSEPVKHGHWKRVEVDGEDCFGNVARIHLSSVCSVCGHGTELYSPPYCPHCGVKMDDEVKE